MAQTSIDWINRELVLFMNGNSDYESVQDIFIEGNQFHKQEIVDAFNYAMNWSVEYVIISCDNTEAENYYNETFKSN
ncbi:MAG: hypothetical protein ACOVNU_04150 [Candidatus Kapaibacteriota bacterium]